MVLFLKNKRFNVTLFLSDYQLRWRRLPIEERGGGDYKLRSALAAKQVWVAMITR